MSEKVNSGGLISYNAADRTITLKKGHTYNVCFTGSLRFNSNDSKNLSMGVWLEDGYQPDIAKSATFTREYNEGNKYVSLRIPMTYIRFYVADSQDITLQYTLLKEHSGTYVDYLGYHLTITALNWATAQQKHEPQSFCSAARFCLLYPCGGCPRPNVCHGGIGVKPRAGEDVRPVDLLF